MPESSKATPRTVFSRRLDRKKLEARGAVSNPEISAEILLDASTFNNATWDAEQRQELLTYLRDRPAEPTATFDEGDARIIAMIQSGSGAEADGKLCDETMAVLLAAGFRFSAREENPLRVELHFYPGELEDRGAWDEATNGKDYYTIAAPEGEGVLYVRAGGRIVATYRARGGPPSTMSGHPGHVADTTTPGSFKLGAPHVHVSKSWEKSQIPWGAEIREQDDGFQFRWPPSTGTWQWATERDGPTLETPLKKSLLKYLTRVDRNGQSVMIWTINDFGPTAWQLVPSANYVHTTPAAEAEAARGVPAVLVHSHGCIHLDPRERDEMVNRGFLRTGVPFVVHEWSEHMLPNMVRRDMLRGLGAAAPPGSRA
ncbi:MAG: hypothetical protein HOV80_25240 [Polyangiaceae bacterium]|nr:hypothetical protein [Polyangiaceae bacterium]